MGECFVSKNLCDIRILLGFVCLFLSFFLGGGRLLHFEERDFIESKSELGKNKIIHIQREF